MLTNKKNKLYHVSNRYSNTFFKKGLQGLHSRYLSNSSCLYIEVNEAILPGHCKYQLIHDALEKLQRSNSDQTQLAKALGTYIQHKKEPIDLKEFIILGSIAGVYSGLTVYLVTFKAIATLAIAIPVLGIMIALGIILGGLIVKIIEKTINRNRISKADEERLQKLVYNGSIDLFKESCSHPDELVVPEESFKEGCSHPDESVVPEERFDELFHQPPMHYGYALFKAELMAQENSISAATGPVLNA